MLYYLRCLHLWSLMIKEHLDYILIFEDDTKPNNILQTTVGYQALLDILIDILKELKEEQKDKITTYVTYLSKAKNLRFNDTSRYPFTSKSRSIFYYDLSLLIWPAKDNSDQRLSKLRDALNK